MKVSGVNSFSNPQQNSNTQFKGYVDKSVIKIVNNIVKDIAKQEGKNSSAALEAENIASRILKQLNGFLAKCNEDIRYIYKDSFWNFDLSKKGFLFESTKNKKLVKASITPNIFQETDYCPQTSEIMINGYDEIEIFPPRVPIPRLEVIEDFKIIKSLKDKIDYVEYIGYGEWRRNSVIRAFLLKLFPKKITTIPYDRYNLDSFAKYVDKLTQNVDPSNINKKLS